MKKLKMSTNFRVCQGLSNDDVGGARGHRISRAGFEIGDFVKKNVGGATVEPLFCVTVLAARLPRSPPRFVARGGGGSRKGEKKKQQRKHGPALECERPG